MAEEVYAMGGSSPSSKENPEFAFPQSEGASWFLAGSVIVEFDDGQ